jgi:GWxTD domain-containing protein
MNSIGRIVLLVLQYSLSIVGILAIPASGSAQMNLPKQSVPTQQANPRAFFMDVLFFKGDKDSTQRVDVYAVVPYQTLNFVRRDSLYVASYIITLTLKDQAGQTLQTIRKERPIREDRLEVTLGSTAGFDYTETSFSIGAGSYSIEAEVSDVLSKRVLTLQRGFKALNTDAMQFALSSLMLASSITQTQAQAGDTAEERFTLTPYLADDVSPLAQDGFYIFFETYNAFGPGLDSLDFVYEVLDEKSMRTVLSKRVRRWVNPARTQQFLKIAISPQVPLGLYTLRLVALRTNTESSDTTIRKYAERDVVAASARTIRLEWKGLGLLAMLKGDDLSRAVRQMRYASTPSEIEKMQKLPTDAEKQKRFYEFWQRLDPTPNTLRNEAFEDYYQRVDYANRNFRYMGTGDGWMSDMGMVYVIFGQPQYTRDMRRDGRIIWSWVYPAFSREFVFVDYTGFGNDFRLTSGMPFEKYRYRR